MASPPTTEARVHSRRQRTSATPLDLAGLAGRRDTAAVVRRGWTLVVGEPLARLASAPALDALAETVGWRDTPGPDEPPFHGGAVGAIAEHAGDAWLDLPPDPRPPVAGLEALSFGVYDTAACWPPDGEEVTLVAADVPGYSREPVEDRLDRLAAQLDEAARRPHARQSPSVRGEAARCSLDREAHRAAVERAQQWISAGDLYQLNLTLQIAVPWPAPPIDLAHRLWHANPHAAHAAWLDLGGAQVASVSPETFLRTEGDVVWVRPIKGTRPRHDDPASDAGAADELLASAKDHAEHVMIVDLERNDLGRVCATGSVRVPELAALESHPTVWHLTSTVRGRLARRVGVADLLAALFPCGSVTGAPKRMAVARTRLLEPTRRGVYCGAIGTLSRGGLELSVGIRTATIARGVARYGAGGGIVADSDPAAEHEEAMDKAAAFARATGARLPRAASPRGPPALPLRPAAAGS
ncbi:anthranilate synthase component I family protein [Egibacter rhizosphaerae]|uniref:Anthranilate synthase component I family protein n=1 Tax=Egibacter rhizosphaerae TaxID=1670831 RepID=A0A411YAL0_9ACTN|nr:anthranilate synthase component I family protein [Egibacter rhizosphaerae]QBI18244.1 anthranilate synthase component I family protein [Egibacter rhizosphaerae]